MKGKNEVSGWELTDYFEAGKENLKGPGMRPFSGFPPQFQIKLCVRTDLITKGKYIRCLMTGNFSRVHDTPNCSCPGRPALEVRVLVFFKTICPPQNTNCPHSETAAIPERKALHSILVVTSQNSF